MTQQLQPGADGEDDNALGHRLAQRWRLEREIVGRDRHLDILAAVEQDDVELAEVGRLALLDGHDIHGDAPPLRPALDGDEIAAVPGHVEE